MVQMTAADQAIVMAIPGNSKCVDCGMKNPQWASVSFGTVFCLECSGVHRYVGCEQTLLSFDSLGGKNAHNLAFFFLVGLPLFDRFILIACFFSAFG